MGQIPRVGRNAQRDVHEQKMRKMCQRCYKTDDPFFVGIDHALHDPTGPKTPRGLLGFAQEAKENHSSSYKGPTNDQSSPEVCNKHRGQSKPKKPKNISGNQKKVGKT